MAKSAKAPKAAKAKTPQEEKIESILDEMKSLVFIGMKPKTLAAGVEEGLREAMRPRIKQRLDNGGDWEEERENPLICALHLGLIAKILSKGNTVSKTVAKTALDAIKNDEHCLPGPGGGGDWCA